ncbi:MAG TPA: hypothetical protein VN648_07055 [Candidatus Methylomirabilis sp.]|nr:hypothetical protein [Candidatus Methylomirabilis sp.]
MAGRKVYITIPAEDYELLTYAGVLTGECRGQIARRYVLGRLYHELLLSTELQGYEQDVRARRREKLERGR